MRYTFYTIYILLLLAFPMRGKAQIESSDSEYLMAKGIALASNARYLEAVVYFQKILPSETLYVEAQSRIALAYYYSKQYANAIKVSKRGIEIADGNDVLFHYALSNSHYEMTKYWEAAFAFQQATKAYPFHANFWWMRGLSNMQINKSASAIVAFQRHIELHFDQPQAHFLLGYLLADAGRTSSALMSLGVSVLLSQDTAVCAEALRVMQRLVAVEYEKQLPASVNHQEDSVLIDLELALENQSYFLKKRRNDSLLLSYKKIANDLPYQSISLNFWMRNYAVFYKNLQDKKQMQVFITTIMAKGNKDENAKKWLKKKKKQIQKFEEIWNSFLQNRRDSYWDKNIPIAQETRVWRNEKNDIFALGRSSLVHDTITRQGYWKYIDRNGKVTSEGAFREGKKNGIWQHFYPTGKLKRKIAYSRGVQIDSVWTYFPSGQLQSTTPYKQGRINGTQEKYFEIGMLERKQDYTDNLPNGQLEIYFPNGHIKALINYREGQAEGLCSYFYENGTLKSKQYFSANYLEGKSQFFYPDGSLKTRGSYHNSKKVGHWQWFFSDSSLLSESSFNTLGEKEGTSVSYYANGQTEETRFYIKGILDGKVFGYAKTGEKLYEYYYNKGRLISYTNFKLTGDTLTYGVADAGKLEVSTHYPDGTLEAKGNFLNGEKHGMWHYFYSNGKLSQVQHYEFGLRMGESKSYYPDGKPKAILFYNDNLAEGKYISYYRNDTIREVGNYENDSRFGKWLAYYANGEKRSEEFYEGGKLHGMQFHFHPDGRLSHRQLYAYGIMVSVDFYDTIGQETSLRKFDLSDTLYTAYYPTGEVRMRSAHRNGQLNGCYSTYFPDGRMHEKGTLKQGELHGYFVRYYNNGIAERKGQFQNGDAVGNWAFFDRNTHKYKEVHYSNKHTASVFFNKKGKEIERIEEKNDILDGFHFIYNPYGNIICRKTYREGMLVSYAYPFGRNQFSEEIPINYDKNELVVYYKNGKTAIKEVYDDGYLARESALYYPNGQIARKTQYKYGVKHGNEQIFHPSGNLRQTANYFYGKKNGTQRSYTKQKQLEHVQNFLYGLRHGEQVYYANGKVIYSSVFSYNEVSSVQLGK